MKVLFIRGGSDDQILLSEAAFVAKIDKSLKLADTRDTKKLTNEELKVFLGLGFIKVKNYNFQYRIR